MQIWRFSTNFRKVFSRTSQAKLIIYDFWKHDLIIARKLEFPIYLRKQSATNKIIEKLPPLDFVKLNNDGLRCGTLGASDII